MRKNFQMLLAIVCTLVALMAGLRGIYLVAKDIADGDKTPDTAAIVDSTVTEKESNRSGEMNDPADSGYNFGLEEIETGKEEFYEFQAYFRGEAERPETSVYVFEPDGGFFGIVFNKETGERTSIHLPKPWKLGGAAIDVGISLVYVAHPDKVVTYCLGDVVEEYPLPYTGKWRLLRGITKLSKDYDVFAGHPNAADEIMSLIANQAILLVEVDKKEAWAILDGKLVQLEEDVQDCCLHLGPEDDTGDHATAFFWMDSSKKVYIKDWKKKKPSVLVGDNAIGVSKSIPGFVVDESDERHYEKYDGQCVVVVNSEAWLIK